MFLHIAVYQISSFTDIYKNLQSTLDLLKTYKRETVLIVCFSSDQIDIILFDNGTDAAANNSKKVERWEEVSPERDREEYRTCRICTSAFYEVVGLF